MADVIKLGLKLGTFARSEIDLLSKAHKEFWPRHPKQTSGPIFIIDDFKKYFVELLTAVTLAIRDGNRLYVSY
jgi:hypothetical protein